MVHFLSEASREPVGYSWVYNSLLTGSPDPSSAVLTAFDTFVPAARVENGKWSCVNIQLVELLKFE